MRKIQLPEDFIWLIDYLFDVVLGNPENSVITNDIEKLLGRPPITFKDFADDVAKTGLWDAKTIKA